MVGCVAEWIACVTIAEKFEKCFRINKQTYRLAVIDKWIIVEKIEVFSTKHSAKYQCQKKLQMLHYITH